MQALFIFVAIIAGLLLPQAHPYVFLIRYLLMGMLLFSFINVEFRWDILQRDHWKLVALNILLPVLAFVLLRPFHSEAAMAVLVIGLAPTAAVAPVMAGFLRARVDLVTAAVIITSPVMALVLPLLLPLLIKTEVAITVGQVLLPVASVVFLPLLLATALQKLWPYVAGRLRRFRRLTFVFFLANVFLASANASHFVREDGSTQLTTFIWIGGSILVFCLLLFQIGERIGPRRLAMEYSLSLGRKNTMFAIWVALTFISPVVALGPMFYILAHNLYNSWQILEQERRRGAVQTDTRDTGK